MVGLRRGHNQQEPTFVYVLECAGPQTRAALHMALAAGATIAVTASPITNEVVVDVPAPGRGVADSATGSGVASMGLGGVLQTLQEQLTPFSSAGGWIGRLVVILIVVGAVLTIGGLAWRWIANRKKAATVASMNAPVVVKP